MRPSYQFFLDQHRSILSFTFQAVTSALDGVVGGRPLPQTLDKIRPLLGRPEQLARDIVAYLVSQFLGSVDKTD